MSLYTGEQPFETPPVHEITSIRKDPEKPVEKDVLTEITEVAKAIDVEHMSRVEVLQELGQLMVSSLVSIQRDVDTTKRSEISKSATEAQKVQTFVRSLVEPLQVPGETWHTYRNGFLAEVATTIFMEKAGFEILETSQEDDMKGKIDLWAYDSAEKKVYAVQVKASKDFEGAKLYKVDKEKESLGVMSGYRDSVKTMVKYVAGREELAEKDIDFLVIELGAGELSEAAAFNQMTGVLSDTADESLNDQFYAKIWS